jgi:hypothetical protein
MYLKILTWPRTAKGLVVVTLDVTLSLIATWLAFSLGLDALHWPQGLQWRVYALAPVLAILILCASACTGNFFSTPGSRPCWPRRRQQCSGLRRCIADSAALPDDLGAQTVLRYR